MEAGGQPRPSVVRSYLEPGLHVDPMGRLVAEPGVLLLLLASRLAGESRPHPPPRRLLVGSGGWRLWTRVRGWLRLPGPSSRVLLSSAAEATLPAPEVREGHPGHGREQAGARLAWERGRGMSGGGARLGLWAQLCSCCCVTLGRFFASLCFGLLLCTRGSPGCTSQGPGDFRSQTWVEDRGRQGTGRDFLGTVDGQPRGGPGGGSA